MHLQKWVLKCWSLRLHCLILFSASPRVKETFVSYCFIRLDDFSALVTVYNDNSTSTGARVLPCFHDAECISGFTLVGQSWATKKNPPISYWVWMDALGICGTMVWSFDPTNSWCTQEDGHGFPHHFGGVFTYPFGYRQRKVYVSDLGRLRQTLVDDVGMMISTTYANGHSVTTVNGWLAIVVLNNPLKS